MGGSGLLDLGGGGMVVAVHHHQILLKKNALKYDIFFKLSEKMVFSKTSALGNDLSCIIWKDEIFFLKT